MSSELNQRALRYFLESSQFHNQTEDFLWNFRFAGLVQRCESDGTDELEYMTDIGLQFYKAEQENGGFYSVLRKAGAEKYFSKDYDDCRLSVIFMAIIFERSQEEIKFIADKRRNSAYCPYILNSLICGLTVSEIREIFATEDYWFNLVRRLCEKPYQGNYYLFGGRHLTRKLLDDATYIRKLDHLDKEGYFADDCKEEFKIVEDYDENVDEDFRDIINELVDNITK